MLPFDIEKTFHTTNSKRDKFLSRLFGIFSEDIVRYWCNNKNSKYSDMGRPTLWAGNQHFPPLDFSFRDHSGKTFIGEQKCELEYQGYQYLELSSLNQVERHQREKSAFRRFLDMAKDPESYTVKINRSVEFVHGAILVWGRINKNKKNEIKKYFHLHDILTIEEMVNDLIKWKDPDYFEYINTKYIWMTDLMSKLSGARLKTK